MHLSINVSDYLSWQICLVLLLISLFLIWMFWGGKEIEYVGYKPLQVEIPERKADSSSEYSNEVSLVSSYIDDETENEIEDEKDNEIEDEKDDEKDETQKSIQNRENKESNKSYSFETKKKALGDCKCFHNNNLSKGEKLCKQVLEDMFKKPFYCVRPDFLKNPESGRNLELDLYNDDLKLAVEYSGAAHYTFPNGFHKTYDEFISQVRRDEYKLQMCDKNGVYLITVPYTVPLNVDAIKNYIHQRLPEDLQVG